MRERNVGEGCTTATATSLLLDDAGDDGTATAAAARVYLKGRAADEALGSTQPSKRVMPVAASVTPWGVRFSTAVQLITGLLLPTMMVACLSSPSNRCVHTCSCVWSSSAEIGLSSR